MLGSYSFSSRLFEGNLVQGISVGLTTLQNQSTENLQQIYNQLTLC